MRRDTVLALSSVGLIGSAMFAVIQSGAPGGMEPWHIAVCAGVDLISLVAIARGGANDGDSTPPENPTP